MPLVMNGVIIPENVANALYFNGVNITDVFMNGVQVWNQSLFSATWSGGLSQAKNSLGTYLGLDTSGSQHRAWHASGTGSWVSVSSSGIFTNATSLVNLYDGIWIYSGGAKGTLGNEMSVSSEAVITPTKINFTVGIGFSGNSVGGGTNKLVTSGGLVRFESYTLLGAWLSLT